MQGKGHYPLRGSFGNVAIVQRRICMIYCIRHDRNQISVLRVLPFCVLVVRRDRNRTLGNQNNRIDKVLWRSDPSSFGDSLRVDVVSWRVFRHVRAITIGQLRSLESII